MVLLPLSISLSPSYSISLFLPHSISCPVSKSSAENLLFNICCVYTSFVNWIFRVRQFRFFRVGQHLKMWNEDDGRYMHVGIHLFPDRNSTWNIFHMASRVEFSLLAVEFTMKTVDAVAIEWLPQKISNEFLMNKVFGVKQKPNILCVCEFFFSFPSFLIE